MSDPWWLEILLRLKRPENDEYSNVVQRLCQNILRRRLNLTKSFEDNFRALRLRTTSRCYEESSEFFSEISSCKKKMQTRRPSCKKLSFEVGLLEETKISKLVENSWAVKNWIQMLFGISLKLVKVVEVGWQKKMVCFKKRRKFW